MTQYVRRIRTAGNLLCGRLEVRRSFVILPDDRLLVSYPKSGNTWTRFLAAHLLRPDAEISFANIEKVVPDMYVNSLPQLRRIPSPRVLKSHEPYNPKFRRVLYIVRDPRDVAVSYYHHLIKAGEFRESDPLDAFVDRFLGGQLDKYGSWGENVGSWLGARGRDPDFEVLRYEDLHGKPMESLARLASFLSVTADTARLQMVYENCRAEKLQRIEKRTARQWAAMRDWDASKPFVRRGKAGGWREELSASAARAIESRWEDLMQRLGYLDGGTQET